MPYIESKLNPRSADFQSNADAMQVLDDGFHVFHADVQSLLSWNDPLRHAGHHEGEGGNLSAPMPVKSLPC